MIFLSQIVLPYILLFTSFQMVKVTKSHFITHRLKRDISREEFENFNHGHSSEKNSKGKKTQEKLTKKTRLLSKISIMHL